MTDTEQVINSMVLLGSGVLVDCITQKGSASSKSPSRQCSSSLRQACVRKIKLHINIHTVLPLLQFLQSYGHALSCSKDIEAACLTFVLRTYRCLREVHGPLAVRAAVGTATWEPLERGEQDFMRTRRLLAVRGRVLQSVSFHECQTIEGGSRTATNSVAGLRAYPYKWLLAGKQWPTDVDPAWRERFLDEPNFESLFKMSYATFSSLPEWRQVQLKQEKLLW